LQNRQYPINSARSNLAALRLCRAAIQSARSRTLVNLLR
jgi:hypothetical protein